VQIEPDFTGKWPSLYTQGPRSVSPIDVIGMPGIGTPEWDEGSGTSEQTPTTHANTHKEGGVDELTPSDIGAAEEVHNLIDTTNHPASGLTAGHFLKATGETTYDFEAHGLSASDVGALAEGSLIHDPYDEGTHTGLDFSYGAGLVRDDNIISTTNAGTVTLTDDSTNYIEVDPSSGVVSANTTGFTERKIPLYEAVTVSGEITVITDRRAYLGAGGASELPEHMEWVNTETAEGLAVYDDPPTNSSMVALIGRKGTLTEVYKEDEQADFEKGELDGVQVGEEGLELESDDKITEDYNTYSFTVSSYTSVWNRIEFKTTNTLSAVRYKAKTAGDYRLNVKSDNGAITYQTLLYGGALAGEWIEFQLADKIYVSNGGRYRMEIIQPSSTVFSAIGLYNGANWKCIQGAFGGKTFDYTIAMGFVFWDGYCNSGRRFSPPLDLSGLSEAPDLRASWQATEPDDTSVKVLTAVTEEEEVFEISRTEEGAGFEDGVLDGVVAGESGLGLGVAQLIQDNDNLALNKSVSAYLADGTSVLAKDDKPFTIAVDGNTSSSNYAEANSDGERTCIQVDLGVLQFIDRVKVWHYYTDGRIYNKTKVEISGDGENWFTVFDSAVSGTYAETSAGKLHIFEPREVRYIRDWVNGSNKNSSNHWVEIQVFGGQFLYDDEGSRLAPPLPLSSLGQAVSSYIEWDATIPEDTTLTVETGISEDAETEPATWDEATSGQPIPSISANDDLTGKYLWVRQTLETEDEAVTPTLHSLTVTVEGDTAVGVVVLKPAEPQSDIFTLYLGGATDGTFILTDGTTDTDPIDYDCTAEDIQTALEDLYGEGKVTVEDGLDFTITFDPSIGTSNLGADFNDLSSIENPALTQEQEHDPGDWVEQENGEVISNIPSGDLSGKWLWLKEILETGDTSVTPVLKSLSIYYGEEEYGIFTDTGLVGTI
jgi:hypothetical protein